MYYVVLVTAGQYKTRTAVGVLVLCPSPFFYTQSAMLSPHFIPQSAFYTPVRVLYTVRSPKFEVRILYSAIYSPHSIFYTIRNSTILGAVSRKSRKLFGPAKPLQNLEPWEYRAVLFTYPKDEGRFLSCKKFRATAYTPLRF